MSECGVVKKKFCVFSTVTEKKNEKKKKLTTFAPLVSQQNFQQENPCRKQRIGSSLLC